MNYLGNAETICKQSILLLDSEIGSRGRKKCP
jgi:hypothetical protein